MESAGGALARGSAAAMRMALVTRSDGSQLICARTAEIAFSASVFSVFTRRSTGAREAMPAPSTTASPPKPRTKLASSQSGISARAHSGASSGRAAVIPARSASVSGGGMLVAVEDRRHRVGPRLPLMGQRGQHHGARRVLAHAHAVRGPLAHGVQHQAGNPRPVARPGIAIGLAPVAQGVLNRLMPVQNGVEHLDGGGNTAGFTHGFSFVWRRK